MHMFLVSKSAKGSWQVADRSCTVQRCSERHSSPREHRGRQHCPQCREEMDRQAMGTCMLVRRKSPPFLSCLLMSFIASALERAWARLSQEPTSLFSTFQSIGLTMTSMHTSLRAAGNIGWTLCWLCCNCCKLQGFYDRYCFVLQVWNDCLCKDSCGPCDQGGSFMFFPRSSSNVKLNEHCEGDWL